MIPPSDKERKNASQPGGLGPPAPVPDRSHMVMVMIPALDRSEKCPRPLSPRMIGYYLHMVAVLCPPLPQKNTETEKKSSGLLFKNRCEKFSGVFLIPSLQNRFIKSLYKNARRSNPRFPAMMRPKTLSINSFKKQVSGPWERTSMFQCVVYSGLPEALGVCALGIPFSPLRYSCARRSG